MNYTERKDQQRMLNFRRKWNQHHGISPQSGWQDERNYQPLPWVAPEKKSKFTIKAFVP